MPGEQDSSGSAQQAPGQGQAQSSDQTMQQFAQLAATLQKMAPKVEAHLNQEGDVVSNFDLVDAALTTVVGAAASGLGYMAGQFVSAVNTAVGNTSIGGLPLPVITAGLTFAGFAVVEIRKMWRAAKGRK